MPVSVAVLQLWVSRLTFLPLALSVRQWPAKRTAALRVVLISFVIISTAIPLLAERLPLKAYTVADGLANNTINKIVRDKRGFLWFCTGEGVSRFDGYAFTNYSVSAGLPHPNVTDLLETSNGEIWIGTFGGLVRFSPKQAQLNRVVLANDAPIDSPPMFSVIVPQDEDRQARAVTALLESRDGTIWVGTFKGLFRLERTNNRFELVPVDIGMPSGRPGSWRHITDLQEDQYGSLWIASFSGLYRRWKDGTAANYTVSNGLPDDTIHDLLMDHRGQLWVGSRFGGFFRIAANETHASPTVTDVYQLDGSARWVFQLFETSEHRFWVATNTGLVEFNRDNGQYRAYTRRHGLSFQEINALAEDSGDNLWLGSTLGAMKLARGGFVTYEERDGILTVGAVFGDRAGGVCVTADLLGDERTSVFDGAKIDVLHPTDKYHTRFGRFDGQRFTWFKPSEPRTEKLGWVAGLIFQTRNGEWWLGSAIGIYRFPATDEFTGIAHSRPIAIYQSKEGLSVPRSQQVFRMFEDSRRNIWASTIATPNGISRWDPNSDTFVDLSNSANLPSPENDLARSFGEDLSGNIWIGFSTGLARYRDGSFTFFDADDGLPRGAIEDIHTDKKGRLWLASSRGGLIRIDDPTVERPTFRSYTTSEGLASNKVTIVCEDLGGVIYVVTGRGLERVDPETDRIKHFTAADGLPDDEILDAYRANDGAIWLATRKGLSRFVPRTDVQPLPPPALITGLRVAGIVQTLSSLGEAAFALPDLNSDQNQIQIDFVGISFAAGEVLRYQYQLAGGDNDWSSPTDQRTVTYARLAPGNYQFRVRAINADGVASLSPAVITFTVLRPVWQRWWFLSLIALVVASLAYSAYRYRVSRLVQLERVRTRIATDLHDDIGANLTRISLLSELAKQQNGNGSLLTSIADIARESVSSMNDIVWAISPESDRLLDLTSRMRQHAEEVFSLRDIKLEINLASSDSRMHLPAGTRRDVLLIFKEAVNNAARHSNCTAVRIDFHSDQQQLRLTIFDDGKGFDKTSANDGHGLRSMERRARTLGGEFRVDTVIGTGTTVVLELPVSKWSEA